MAESDVFGPPVQLAIRHKEAWELLMLDKNEKLNSIASLEPCDFMRYGRDGCFLLCTKQKEGIVEVFDTNPDNVRCVMQFEHPGVRSASLSPKNSFLLTYNRRRKEDKEGNLVVWSIETQAPIMRLFITPPDVFNPDEAPIRWSGDETLAFRKVKTGILVCDGTDPTKTLTKIEQTRIEQWSVSPTKTNLAIFIPEHKKSRKPGCVVAYRGDAKSFECVASSTFYNAEEVDFDWSSSSDCVLCVASDEVDRTGSSYYGAKRLYLLNVLFGISCRVPIADGAPLQATGWMANGRDFIAVHDHPFRADVWRAGKKGCVEIHKFDHDTYNNTKASPDGRFLCLCGFGNLPGHMYFWDYETKKHLGHAQYASATNFKWSPNGRFFLTSRLHPTRRVENGLTLWDYCGNEVDKHDYGELYQTTFRPAPAGTYKSRPPSPTRKGTPARRAAREQGQYVPPHLRGRMRKDQNSPKRKKKKNKPKQPQQPQQEVVQSVEPEELQKPAELDPQKQVRKLNKKLKQIEQLKEKLARGEDLNADQHKKISQEVELKAELQTILTAAGISEQTQI